LGLRVKKSIRVLNQVIKAQFYEFN